MSEVGPGPAGRIMELHDLATAVALKELELSAQGYPPRQVAAAIRWAWRRAEGMASKAPPGSQEAVFVAIHSESLEASGRWLDGNAAAAAGGDMAQGLDRAVRDRKAQRGYKRLGVDGRHAVRRWKEGVPASKERYREFFT